MVANVVLDLSSHQHPTGQPITWAAVAAAPVHVIGVAVKATQGTIYTNPFYAGDVAGAQAHGIPAVGYHFAGFGTAAREAAFFKAVAGTRARVLDAETSTDAAWMNAFWADMGTPATLDLTYGSASTIPRTLKSELWPADYTANPGFGTLWQAGDNLTVPGIPVPTDYSVPNTLHAFEIVFGVTAPAPPPLPAPVPAPPPSPAPSVVVVPVSIGADGCGWTRPTAFTVNDLDSIVGISQDPTKVGKYVKVARLNGITAAGQLVFVDGVPGVCSYRVRVAS